jgi:hypothetical protein
MSDYTRLEVIEYGFNIFLYRGGYYFEFTIYDEDEYYDIFRDNGFHYQETIVHGADNLEKRWSRRKSINGTDGLVRSARAIMEARDNRDWLKEKGIDKIDYYLKRIATI